MVLTRTFFYITSLERVRDNKDTNLDGVVIIVKDQITRKILNGIIPIHILHHGMEEPFYGSFMIEELKEHGYQVSPGTLYPVLKTMVEEGLLQKEERNINGRIRKYYQTTEAGSQLFNELKHYLKELTQEVYK